MMPTIQQQLNQLKKDKETLNTMLNTMGVETTGNETFTQLTPLVGKIVTDPILQDKSIEISENGTTNIVADEGYDGLNNVDVIVNVEGEEDLTEELTVQDEEITEQETSIDNIIEALQGKVISGGEEMVKYSTEEQVVGEWIDGKPVYRKTLAIPSVVKHGTVYDVQIAIGTTIDILVDLRGYISNGSTYFLMNQVRYDDVTNGISCYVVSNNTVVVETGKDRTTYTGYLTIDYTKTTD